MKPTNLTSSTLRLTRGLGALVALGVALAACILEPIAACPNGLADCGGFCIDVSLDPENCGACKNSCGSQHTCDQGYCGVDCGPFEERCGATSPDTTSECTDTGSDEDNCGGCGIECLPSQYCFAGSCRTK